MEILTGRVVPKLGAPIGANLYRFLFWLGGFHCFGSTEKEKSTLILTFLLEDLDSYWPCCFLVVVFSFLPT